MKPLKLLGHQREINRVRYNVDGDLLFSAGADPYACVWLSNDGQQLGSYNTKGAVTDLDITFDTRLICTSGYSGVGLFDCETGTEVNKLATGTAINKACGFSLDGNLVMSCRKAMRGERGKLFIFDIRDASVSKTALCVDLTQSPDDDVTVGVWLGLGTHVAVGMESGDINMWDVRSAGSRPEPVISRRRAHEQPINDMHVSRDHTMLATCSRDGIAHLWGAFQLEEFKTFKADRPLNSVALAPRKPHLIMGGGQMARDAALLGGAGAFEALFYHTVFEENFAKIKDHFGPIKSLEFHPNGIGYTSGAHDGMIFIHKFDAVYDKFEIEY